MAVCSKVIGTEVLCAQHATSNVSIGRIGAMGNIAASKRHFDIRIQWKSCVGKMGKCVIETYMCYDSVTSADNALAKL